ncbi:MAG: hypothetical protein JJT94_09505 [Bernardetiaceae bacterium]|nr:hypothetical protein [Bernardetiaceae bacterium]
MEPFTISKQDDKILVRKKWYSCVYIVFAFGVVIWNSFVLLSYFFDWFIGITLVTGALGLLMTYLIACGFLNTTYIEISKQTLLITHRPLPWFGGKRIDATKIKQVFVYENLKHNDSYYELHYIDDKAHQHKILDSTAIGGGVEGLQMLEHLIEDFLGIEDKTIEVEYEAAQKLKAKRINNRHARHNPQLKKEDAFIHLTCYDLIKDDLLDWKNKTFKVIREVQYDWENSESHRQVQISDKQQKHLLYMIRKGAKLLIFAENRISLNRIFPDLEQQLKDELPPPSLSYKNQTYWREQSLRGNKFLLSEPKNPFFPVKVWVYFNQDESEMLRIENFDNFDFKIFHSTAQKEKSFTNLLGAFNS